MSSLRRNKNGYSRRQFLKIIPIGIVTGLVASAVSGKLITMVFAKSHKYPTFPEGSIFTPDRDQHEAI